MAATMVVIDKIEVTNPNGTDWSLNLHIRQAMGLGVDFLTVYLDGQMGRHSLGLRRSLEQNSRPDFTGHLLLTRLVNPGLPYNA